MTHVHCDADGCTMVAALMDRRIACDPAKVRTIITMNLTKAEVRPRYGSRIADRLNAHAAVVECAGESMRGRSMGL